MDKQLSKRANYADIEQFRLAVYNKKSKDKTVTYYVLDPDSVLSGEPRLKRMRKKFCGIHSSRERDASALRFCDEINRRLKKGWNPLISSSSEKAWTPISKIIEHYTLYINKESKEKVITQKTLTDYSGRLKMFSSYIKEENSISYVYQLDRQYVETFLEYIYIDRDTSPRTRNNYLGWLSSFCSYLVCLGYLDKNPCDDIPNLRNGDKKRKPLTAEDLNRLHVYLNENNLFFLLACQVHFYTFIRPNEMSYIKIGDISVSEQTIFVSHEVAKNHHDSKVTLPKKVLQLMLKLGVLSFPSNYFLFGKNFMPNENRADSRIFREYWQKVRDVLNFPDVYQFYSLKDTGITESIDKNGLSVTKDQARHSDISTTNHYVRREQMTAHAELKEYDGCL